MIFKHSPITLEPISSVDTPDGRYYNTSGGRFPSVTTVLGRYKGQAALNAWRERVGPEAAKKVSTKATGRGSRVHELAEKYVIGDPDWAKDAMPSNLFMFDELRKELDARLDEVYGIEVPLWSSTLRTGGRADLLGRWDGVPSILDYKTSKRKKTEAEVHGYFLQKTCYGMMVEERTGIHMPQIVTLMMVDHEEPVIWVKERKNYEEEVRAIFCSDRPWEVVE